ncbi:MAG: hypothetical protein NC483_04435 [Ruminococcus sp.]|nr:hypothetical protein [Ruminococcus sp.]
MNKIKKLLYYFFKYLKILLTSIVGFFFSLFNYNDKKEKPKKKIKNIDYPKHEKEKYIEPDFSTYHNEDPGTRKKDNTNYIYTVNDLKIWVKEIFLEELLIKEEDLTKKNQEYLEQLTIKIVPLLNEKTKNNSINTKDEVKNVLRPLIKEELETKLKKEQNNIYEPQIILPLITKNNFNTKLDILVTNNQKEIKKPKENNQDFTHNKQSNENESKENSLNVSNYETSKNVLSKSNNYTYELPPNPVVSNDPLTSKIAETTTIETNSEAPNLEHNTSSPVFIKPNLNLDKDSCITSSNIQEETKNTEPNSLDNKPQTINKKENPQETFDTYNPIPLDNYINNYINAYSKESKKEDFEDKNYELLEEQLNNLLQKISELKLLNLRPYEKEALNKKENQIRNLKDKLENQKQQDITNEVNTLNENITNEDLKTLELELKKLYLEDKLDLQEKLLNNLEDLEKISYEKAKLLEKALLKQKLKRTLNILNISNLPFFRNKFFRYFATNLLANKELKSFHSILKRKDLEFEMPELTEIKKGHYALEDATILSKENYEYLNYLEREALKKHPELILDNVYSSYINTLKTRFLKNQEKLQNKEKVLTKYRIKIEKRVRKLKKNNLNNLPINK